MTHRLGSVLSEDILIGPGAEGHLADTNIWEFTFNPSPAPGGTKFLMLHFADVSLPDNNRLVVDLSYDSDEFTAASDIDFWTRPVPGNSATVRITNDDGGAPEGSARLVQYGRGEGLQGDPSGLDNTNADVFLLDLEGDPDARYEDPAYTNPGGLCGERSWENVTCIPEGDLMRTTAQSAGIIIAVSSELHPGSGCFPGEGECLSSCSAALIDMDLILTAAHCFADNDEIKSASITFDFQTNCDGSYPDGYSPRFYKLKDVVRSGFRRDLAAGDTRAPLDYSIIQIETPPGGLGLPPLQLRPDLPDIGDPVFAIHHPRGATKKISWQGRDPSSAVQSISGNRIRFGADLDNGSSGSSLFDASGRIIGVNNWAGCPFSPDFANEALASFAILEDFLTEPPPPQDVDVVIVFDRSGSMSLSGLAGDRSKIAEAIDAAHLFIDLIRTTANHQIGLVSFSTRASDPPEFSLAPVTDPNKETLIGPPLNESIVGQLEPDELTTIGGGLRAGQNQLSTSGRPTNNPFILLLTDGLQNTPPMIEDVEAELGDTKLCIVGFGSEASLNGPLLTRLARDHGGHYTRDGEGLGIRKLFTLCFGNIFETGPTMDPFYVFPEGATDAEPISFGICGEESLTAVLSWENPNSSMRISLITPGGNTITRDMPEVTSSRGLTWAFIRISLPFNDERDGNWQIQVSRRGGEFQWLPEERFFVAVTVQGGPYLRHLDPPHYYTGDTINPAVLLRKPSGGLVGAEVTVAIEMPTNGTGNILTENGLNQSLEIDGDRLDRRASTLISLEQERGSALIETRTETFELFDDGEHDDGAMESDGIYGNPLPELTRYEGNYTFTARATFGEECTTTRETSWSAYVSVGIDPDNTEVGTETVGPLPDGRVRLRVTFTPRDRYGNYLGPGRLDSFEVHGQPGSELVGAASDAGNGSYVQDVAWDPASGEPPRVAITQPQRPPVGLTSVPPATRGKYSYSVKFICGVQKKCKCNEAPVRPGRYATEINIYNHQDTEVRLEKFVVPVVFAGAASGREPKFTGRKAADQIVLPPHSATMDDCKRIAELLLGAQATSELPLTIGFLEIVSSHQVNVTVTYTSTDLKSRSITMDVEQVEGKKIDQV